VPIVKHERHVGLAQVEGEPGEADEQHHRAEPVLRPLTAGREPAADVGPADHERGHGLGDAAARLPVAAEDHDGRARAGRECKEHGRKLTPHALIEEILHRRPRGVQAESRSPRGTATRY
jgi:hypothetical protein